MHLHDALDRYLVQLQADGRSIHTRKQVGRHVRALARWLEGEGHTVELEGVIEEGLARFLCSDSATKRPDGKPKRAASVNALRSSLRTFFSYAHEAGLAPTNAARLIRLANCSPPLPRGLRDHEEQKLRAVMKAGEGFEAERDRVLFELLLATGIRLGSALALDVADLDLEDGTIHLRTVKRGQEQTVFLPAATRGLLAGLVGERRVGPVFGSAAGDRITTRHAQRRFRAVRERARVSRQVTPHGCRHRFAMRLYERTHDLLVVQAALGHRSLGSSLVYARTTGEEVRRAVAGAGAGL